MVSVNTIQAITVFAWFMLIMIIRRIIMFIIAGIVARNKPLPLDRAPEDRILARGRIEPTAIANAVNINGDFNKIVRVNKVITNDTENDTYFLILLLATATFSDIANGNCIRTIVYSTIYLFFRILYAIAYIMALQPMRTIVFYISFACILACNIDLVITMSRQKN